MRLTVKERFELGTLIPERANFATLKIHRELREKLSLTEDENEKLKVQVIPSKENPNMGMTLWDLGAAAEIGEVEMAFSPAQTAIVVQVLQKLNAANQLGEQHFSLYEKFVEAESATAGE